MPQIKGTVYGRGAGGQVGLDGVPVFLHGLRDNTQPVGQSTTTSRGGAYEFPVADAASGKKYELSVHLIKELDLDANGIPEWELATNTPIEVEITGRKVTKPPEPAFYEPLSQAQPLSAAVQGVTQAIDLGSAQVSDAIGEATTFSLLTEEVSLPDGATRAGGVVPSSSLAQIADGAVQEVLGWRPRNGDGAGFVAALTQSFALEEVEGHTEWAWTPRTYVVQTDLAAAITGAQASLYTRAQSAIDDSLPLLDGLTNLRLDADPQDMEAIRSVVRGQLQHLVREIGREGGPRVARVEQLLEQLLGEEEAIPPDPDDVMGQLGRLRREFGLRSARRLVADPPPFDLERPIEDGDLVNTVDEEEGLTNFRILADYVVGLRMSWMANRAFFQRPPVHPFFGTELVRIERQLLVISESVREVEFALSSVFVAESERRTTQIVFPAVVQLPAHPPQRPAPIVEVLGVQQMFVDELLSWVSSFSEEEGPDLIKGGGKFAVGGPGGSVLPTAALLRNLVLGAIRLPGNPDPPIGRGYRTERVRRSLAELATQLDELTLLATPIQHEIPSQ